MIATEKFVYVHMPKTGGTFVATVLFRLQNILQTRYVRTPRRPNTFFRKMAGPMKHAPVRAIPRSQRQKLVLGTVRNPYDYYVSQYEFGWWKRTEWLKYYRAVPGFKERYSSFPNLSFEEYLRLEAAAYGSPQNSEFDSEQAIGLQTEQFLQFYCREPEKVLPFIDDDYIMQRRYEAELTDIRFIKTSRLNQELHDFLLEMGCDVEDLAFILPMGKVLPGGKGRRKDQRWQDYYTPELKRNVRQRERLLFSMFPEFDV